MTMFIGGPLDRKQAEGDAMPRYLEGPWPGRYELVRTATVADGAVQFAHAYQYDAHYVSALEPEIIWITP